MLDYKVIIIDDRSERNDLYRRMFGDGFEIVQIINHPLAESELSKLDCHCFIIDFVLDQGAWSDNKYSVLWLLSNLPQDIPIIILSGEWTKKITSTDIIELLNTKKKIIDFLDWKDFESENSLFSLNLRIKNDLVNHYSMVLELKDENKTINILHISDLQFGDKYIAESYKLDYKLLAEWINRNNSIDILVISGDIAYSGKEAEYEKAYKWLSAFCENLFLTSNDPNKIILIPGNHDRDLDFEAANNYSFDFSSRKFQEVVRNYYQNYSLIPFSKFAYRLTNNIDMLKQENNYFGKNNYFEPWGLEFLYINTISSYSTKSENLFNDKLFVQIDQDLLDSISTKSLFDRTKLFTILIGHHGPDKLGFSQDEAIWSPIRSFIDTHRINLFLYGHQHHQKTRILQDEDGEFANYLIHSCAPTLLLKQEVRTNDSMRGFDIISLERKENLVRNVIFYHCAIKGTKIKIENYKKYSKIKY